MRDCIKNYGVVILWTLQMLNKSARNNTKTCLHAESESPMLKVMKYLPVPKKVSVVLYMFKNLRERKLPNPKRKALGPLDLIMVAASKTTF